MATLICKKAFRLNTTEGQLKFAAGDKVEGKAAEHWYAKAHCYAEGEGHTDDKETDPIKIALATKEIVLSFVTEENPSPKMEDINKALREAKLPQIKAAERDKFLEADEPKTNSGTGAE